MENLGLVRLVDAAEKKKAEIHKVALIEEEEEEENEKEQEEEEEKKQ